MRIVFLRFVGVWFPFLSGRFKAVCGANLWSARVCDLALLACQYWPALGPRFIDCWRLKIECMWTADFMPAATLIAVRVRVVPVIGGYAVSSDLNKYFPDIIKKHLM
jgi:hypothetical protein